jgi:hypothetical protein
MASSPLIGTARRMTRFFSTLMKPSTQERPSPKPEKLCHRVTAVVVARYSVAFVRPVTLRLWRARIPAENVPFRNTDRAQLLDVDSFDCNRRRGAKLGKAGEVARPKRSLESSSTSTSIN